MARAAWILVGVIAGGCYEHHRFGDDAAPPPESPRIRAIRFVAVGGAEIEGGFHDTWLGLDCTFELASDGVFRCLPRVASSNVWFADAACTRPGLQVIPAREDCGRRYIRRAGCPGEPVAVFERAERWDVDARYRFDRVGGTCARVEEDLRLDVYEPVDPARFASATRELPAEPFGREVFRTEDGRGHLGGTRWDGEPCGVATLETGERVCAPTTRFVSLRDGCDPIYSDTGICGRAREGDLVRVFSIGTCAEEVGGVREIGPMITPAAGCGASEAVAHFSTRPADRARLFTFDDRVEERGRVRAMNLGWAGATEQERLRRGFLDSELDLPCGPREVGGELRCVPNTQSGLTGGVPLIFADPTCETYALPTGPFPSCEPGLVDLQPGWCGDVAAVYRLGEPTTTWWRRRGDRCVPGDASFEVRPWLPVALPRLERVLLP